MKVYKSRRTCNPGCSLKLTIARPVIRIPSCRAGQLSLAITWLTLIIDLFQMGSTSTRTEPKFKNDINYHLVFGDLGTLIALTKPRQQEHR